MPNLLLFFVYSIREWLGYKDEVPPSQLEMDDTVYMQIPESNLTPFAGSESNESGLSIIGDIESQLPQ
jgi:hypothetical protein